jgi:hypothetical protein
MFLEDGPVVVNDPSGKIEDMGVRAVGHSEARIVAQMQQAEETEGEELDPRIDLESPA